MVRSLILCFLLAGCASTPDEPLYDALGGDAGIERIVDGLIRNVAADPRTRPHFRGIHIAGFRERLEVHFCDVAGGPCKWEGRSMKESHRNLGIESAAFNGLVEALIDAMDAEGVPVSAQNRFLARLATMQNDIVVGQAGGR